MKQFCFFSGRFGAYLAPTGQDLNQLVVLCSPAPQESIKTHSLWNLLMNQLSAAGMHSFKFDYWGTGDSQGQAEDFSPEQASEDLELAIQEAKDMSGVERPILLGLRFGANLAATYAKRHELLGLCLWDPIENGVTYLQELSVLHHSLPQEAMLNASAAKQRLMGHLLGHPLSAKAIESLKALSFNPTDEGSRQIKTALYVPDSQNRDYPNWATSVSLEEPIRPSISLQNLCQLVVSLCENE